MVAKKQKQVMPQSVIDDAELTMETKHEETKKEEKVTKNILKPKRPCGCCDEQLAPAGPGQRYFEAPDGHVVLAENSLQQVFDRRLNNGKGGWINPLR